MEEIEDPSPSSRALARAWGETARRAVASAEASVMGLAELAWSTGWPFRADPPLPTAGGVRLARPQPAVDRPSGFGLIGSPNRWKSSRGDGVSPHPLVWKYFYHTKIRPCLPLLRGVSSPRGWVAASRLGRRIGLGIRSSGKNRITSRSSAPSTLPVAAENVLSVRGRGWTRNRHLRGSRERSRAPLRGRPLFTPRAIGKTQGVQKRRVG